MSDLHEFSQELKVFFDARDWSRLHAPKNLAMSLVSEAAELMQHFRWRDEEGSRHLPPEALKEVADEMGDVLINVVALADELGIDLLAAARAKLVELDRRHPVGVTKAEKS
ncbi:MAG: MazG-like family protein [Chlamydiia bacterium]